MRLIDPGSPFLELSPLAANGMYDDAIHGAGLITGIGRVEGRECVIVCNDSTIKGGTYYPMTVKKHLRAQEIARENRLPCIYLVDSGGANLPHQTEVFPDREHFGRIFYNQATLSAARHSADRRGDGLLHRRRRLCAGDVGRDHHRARAGHDLPRRPAAGEGRDRRGGHGRGSRRRRRACAQIRRRRSLWRRTTRMRWRSRAASSPISTPRRPSTFRCSRRASRRYDAAELDGIVPADLRKQYDVREVIARLVDGSEFDEFKALYGTTLVTGFAHLARHAGRHPRQQRHPVFGERAEGRAFHRAVLPAPHSAAVPAEHLRLHGRARLRGRRHRQGRRQDGDGGRLRAGAEDHADRRRLVRRRQLRHVRARLRPALPVHLAERAHLGDGRRAGGARCSRPSSATTSRPRARWSERARRRRSRRRSARNTRSEGNPYYATARLWDDGIIAPSETRRVLALAFSAALNAPMPETKFGVFRM